MNKICYLWGSADVKWKNANWEWKDCQLVQEIIAIVESGVDANELIQPWLREEEQWDAYEKEKRKRLIRLICKVKGQQYNEEKEVKKFKVTVEDIQLVVKTVSGIDLKLKEETNVI